MFFPVSHLWTYLFNLSWTNWWAAMATASLTMSGGWLKAPWLFIVAYNRIIQAYYSWPFDYGSALYSVRADSLKLMHSLWISEQFRNVLPLIMMTTQLKWCEWLKFTPQARQKIFLFPCHQQFIPTHQQFSRWHCSGLQSTIATTVIVIVWKSTLSPEVLVCIMSFIT